MPLPRALTIFFILQAFLGFVVEPTHAANTVSTTVSDSPNISAFGIPTGLITIDVTSTSKFFQQTPTAVTSATNLLGCGGVGQGEYTSGLFNMPEVFQKFQQDVNSPLAKQILTMNYSLPQTAALFDTLNSYGNQRYDQFQRGCSLDALKQDAKQQYLQACVQEQIPLRKQIILTGGNPSGGGQGQTLPDTTVNAMAYAQSWEICSNQYVSNTQALAQRVSVTTAFAKEIRSAEYANIAIRSMLCDERTTPSMSTGCWEELFIPQVRFCNDPSLENQCTDGEYGTEEAPVRLMPFFDMLRLAITEDLNKKIVKNLIAQINSNQIPFDIRESAARTAATKKASQPATDALYPNIADFEKNYMNCRSHDMLWPLQQFVDALNNANATSSTITLQTLGPLAFSDVVDQIKLPDGSNAPAFQDDRVALEGLVPGVVGCVVNQTVPVLDPVIIAESTIHCRADDIDAFYSVAGYDVAAAATREVYNYILSRLRDIKTRLLIEETRPEGQASGMGNIANSGGKLPSKELNHRLATIVGDVMIPNLQSQLERLNQLTEARGEFAQRVQRIYAARAGCVYNQK